MSTIDPWLVEKGWVSDPARATVWSHGVQIAGPGMAGDVTPETGHDYDREPPSLAFGARSGRPRAVISQARLGYLCRRFEAARAAVEALPAKQAGVTFGVSEIQRRHGVRDRHSKAIKAFRDALKMTHRRRFQGWALDHGNNLVPADTFPEIDGAA